MMELLLILKNFKLDFYLFFKRERNINNYVSKKSIKSIYNVLYKIRLFFI